MSKATAQTRPPRRPAVPQPSQPAAQTGRDVGIQAAVVLLVAIFARALHFWAMRDSVFFDVLVCDGRQYDVWARRLAGGDWIGSEVYYQTPLYPYFLGVIYTLVGHSVWAVRFAQAALGSLACVFAARAGAAYFSHRVGWIAGLLLAVYPPALFFDGIVQKAALDLFFMCGLLWATGAAQQRPTAGRFLLAGLLLGGMTLNRENAVVLVPLLLGWIVWLSGRKIQPIAVRCAALVAGLAVVLLPVGLRNQYVGGQFLLTTSQMGPNFYIGNHAGASGLYEPLRAGRGDPLFESLDARLLAEEDLGRPLTASEISDYWMRRSWQDIAADPLGWMKLLVEKWFLTWHRLETVDAESIRIHARESWPLGLVNLVWHFGVLSPLAAAGVWLTRRDWRRLWLLYAILVAFALAVTLFFVFARYRYPLVPVALLFAAAGLDRALQIWRARQATRGRELGVALAVAALVATACNWPLPSLLNDEVAYITVATGLLDDLRPAEARQVLTSAVCINPRSAEAYNNLGVASIKLDELDKAAGYFQQAIKLSPQLALPHQGLGEVYERQGRLDDAIRKWRTAIELDPLSASSYRSLGSAFLALGQVDAAIGELTHALQLEPRSVAGRVDLARALLARGDVAAAGDQLELAREAVPKVSEANNLAWILATAPDDSLRNPAEAVRLAELACRATDYQQADLLDTLAAAHASAGDFAKALNRVDEAIELTSGRTPGQLWQALQERRAFYQQKQPYRDPQLAAGAQAR